MPTEPEVPPQRWEVNKVSNGWVVGRYNGLHFQKYAKFYRREALDRFLKLPECPTCAYTIEDLAAIAGRDTALSAGKVGDDVI